MKTLYVSNYRESSGYSQAARDYILALDHVGVDVVTRPIRMISGSAQLSPRIKELENKDLNNIGCVIQHNLPSEWSYKSGVKNIGMFAYETDQLGLTNWSTNISMMDHIIVFCKQQENAIRNCVKDAPPITVVPHCVDVSKYDVYRQKLDLGLSESTLKFYAIGEFNIRKNWSALLLSYLSSFDSSDDVVLIVKTNKNEEFKKTCESVKNGCMRFDDKTRYPKIILMPEVLTEDEMMRLHLSSDIYLCTSHGESWNIPCTDALGFGNFCLVSDCGGFQEQILDIGLGYRMDGSKGTCFGSTTKDLYTSNETWFNVNTAILTGILSESTRNIDALRKITSQKSRDYRSSFVKDNFSYSVVGQKLKNVIETNV